MTATVLVTAITFNDNVTVDLHFQKTTPLPPPRKEKPEEGRRTLSIIERIRG